MSQLRGQVQGEHKCQNCFLSDLPKPLDMETFDLWTEWNLDIPLVTQIFLEKFINVTYMFQKSKDTRSYFDSKLEKLYKCNDILSNVTSKKFTGFFQKINTQELMMHSKCVSTVFQVTSGTGATMSLSAGERLVQDQSIDDSVYWNTYEKPYTIKVHTSFGEIDMRVNLRDGFDDGQSVQVEVYSRFRPW